MVRLTSNCLTDNRQQEMLQRHFEQRIIDRFISRLNERIAKKNAEIAAAKATGATTFDQQPKKPMTLVDLPETQRNSLFAYARREAARQRSEFTARAHRNGLISE